MKAATESKQGVSIHDAEMREQRRHAAATAAAQSKHDNVGSTFIYGAANT